MKTIEKLITKMGDDTEKVRILKYANYLYNDIVTDENHSLLDELINTLVSVLNEDKTPLKPEAIKDDTMDSFKEYLIGQGISEITAYDYTKRLERIFREYKVTAREVFNRTSGCSIGDFIGMYSKGGIRYDDNLKQHNAPSGALKRFRDFMNL